ncbi:MAG: hypothetical protein COU81_03975 [Candidatus Portnoybacteria bacterium CG10_big_fil_rev_8_21_14_0_10_36_7]|uniref:PPM-type phosphatase domain-containing protein n=1 Tax=Candidatus Portnoybacteria bacterium CG10_big_fil_rev_8_21_14_0_10_36_7 TaxID=1974812 RepID=A0A2M8KD47_9BACT|nr:MAG: hypothetical protein COU81_03975 [Candidatus Portnoybacteria bacterium CG10_big_fil_rev_8_21_14_0_10_36_7]
MTKIQLAVLQDKGPRSYMEDTHCIIRNDKHNSILAGIFDGHGGDEVSNYLVQKMTKDLPSQITGSKSFDTVITKFFTETSKEAQLKFKCGSTAIMFYINNDNLHVANAGDSRLVIFRDTKVKQITRDHRVENSAEKKRLLEAGGRVGNHYVWKGIKGLMPTRSIGDAYFSDVGVISRPELFVTKAPIKKGEYFVVATDGLWDELPNKSVQELCNNSKTAQSALDSLFSNLVYLTGPKDNITIIVGMAE